MIALHIVPVTLAEANEFVRQRHRHHKPVPGSKFCVAVAREVSDKEMNQLGPGETYPGEQRHISEGLMVVGVAIVGRPIARMADDGWTLEVNRTCTDGTPNANSMLYGACRRAAWALGYRRLVTYTLPEESGASLRGAGWKCIGEAGGGKWSRESRPRVDLHPRQVKLRWEAPIAEL